MKGRVLIVAGSDSGGGAGIQADIKAVTCLGSYAATAITALTAQNTLGVFDILDVPEKFIQQQIELVLSDIGADVIKTGMLSKETAIKVIAKSLSKYKKIPLVIDPVMVAKGGHKLLENKAVKALKEKLIPHSFLLTPNTPEAEVLAGIKIKNHDDVLKAGEKILGLGAKNVLLKGGHMKGDIIINILINKRDIKIFKNKRIKTRNTHGTGCTLASAISAYLSQGVTLEKSIEKSIAYVERAIKSAPKIGKGHGPLNHLV